MSEHLNVHKQKQIFMFFKKISTYFITRRPIAAQQIKLDFLEFRFVALFEIPNRHPMTRCERKCFKCDDRLSAARNQEKKKKRIIAMSSYRYRGGFSLNSMEIK